MEKVTDEQVLLFLALLSQDGITWGEFVDEALTAINKLQTTGVEP